ncbi:MAG: endonuclease/exonuclease/phosphatase family protein [Polyangiaceae bacterium]
MLTSSAGAIFMPPKVTHVPPVPPKACKVWQVCEPLLTDGTISPIEWVDSARAPLQDFASGNPTGKLYLMQQNPGALSIGIRVSRGSSCGVDECGPWYTILLFDARRDDTLANVQAATQVREDDRALVITHWSPAHFTVEQFRGVGGPTANTWVQTNNSEQWPTSVQLRTNGSFLEIELDVTLKPFGSSQPSEVLGHGKMGLGLVHTRFDPPTFFTLHYWPGNAATDPVLNALNAPNYFIPYTWETIEFSRPDPTPMSLMTYNVGLLPLGFSGGSGSVEDFASIAATVGGPEVMCFQEVWKHNDRELLAELSDSMWQDQFPGDPSKEIQEAGAPELCPIGSGRSCVPAELASPGLGVEDTGLLLLSKNPIFDASTPAKKYSTNQCQGFDCLEDKGVIWARVGTADSRVAVGDGDEYVWDPDEYVDVFCTHLQASCDTLTDLEPLLHAIEAKNLLAGDIWPLFTFESVFGTCDANDIRKIQAAQLAELRAYIDQKAVPPDRPAFVMGDFNANGFDAHLGASGPYGQVITTLGLTNIAPFDAASSLYSERYDVALGCRGAPPYAVPPVMPTTACDPVLTTPDLFSYAFGLPPSQPKWPRLGVGTNIGDSAFCDQSQYGTVGDVESNRYDHVFVVPPRPSDGELPVFAIPNDPEPFVVLNTYPDPNSQGECFSDHKAVLANVNLARIEDRLSFNPKMDHDVEYVVNRVENLTGDSSGGAEFYAHFEMPSTFKTTTGVYKEDTNVIYPHWHMQDVLNGADLRYFIFFLKEEDTIPPDDDYDITHLLGDVSKSRFDHDISMWVHLNMPSHEPKYHRCLEDLHPDCFKWSNHRMSLMVQDAGTHANFERARIDLSLITKEVP